MLLLAAAGSFAQREDAAAVVIFLVFGLISACLILLLRRPWSALRRGFKPWSHHALPTTSTQSRRSHLRF
jgi:hypothetical protein